MSWRNTTLAWNMVSRWLPSRDDACEYWWRLTGPQLAIMLLQAGYSPHQQYEGLLFHYCIVVPRLGARPQPGGSSKWKSFLTHDASPIEYSWKWNTAGAGPEVRYCIEPIGSFAGTMMDPLNQLATKDLLHELDLTLPNLDLTWFYHFTNAFYVSEVEKNKDSIGAGAHSTSSMFVAFEHLNNDILAKAYFLLDEAGQRGPPGLAPFALAVRSLGASNAALDEVVHFIETDPDGSLLVPDMLAIDCVKPSRSRLKLYAKSPRTCFDSIRNIMTMGGKIKGQDQALAELHELLKLVLGLEEDRPSSAELPQRENVATATSHDLETYNGMTYYFDIAPQASLPDVKLYIAVFRYGHNDLASAQGLADFLKMRGRDQFVNNYMRVLEGLATHRPLDSGRGIQRYIACALQKGSLSMTSYLSPEAHHPSRHST